MVTDWLVWQLVDSAFPSGGFAHSGGLEAAHQQGYVPDADALDRFIRTALIQAERSALPFVVAAHREPTDWPRIDTLCDAFLTNHVANRASRKQGLSLLAAAAATFPAEELRLWRAAARQENYPCHFAPIFGAVTASLQVPLLDTASSWLFLTARSLLSAAVRLGIVGPMQAQAMQHHLGPAAQDIASRAPDLTLDDAAQAAPLLDLLHANHDRLYSRLFQS